MYGGLLTTAIVLSGLVLFNHSQNRLNSLSSAHASDALTLTLDKDNQVNGSNIVHTSSGNNLSIAISGADVTKDSAEDFIIFSGDGRISNGVAMQVIHSITINYVVTSGDVYYKLGTADDDTGLAAAESGSIYQIVDQATYFAVSYVGTGVCSIDSIVITYGCRNSGDVELFSYGIGGSAGWENSYVDGKMQLVAKSRNTIDSDGSTWTVANMTSLVMLKGVEFTYGTVEWDMSFANQYQSNRSPAGIVFGASSDDIYYRSAGDVYQCVGPMFNNNATANPTNTGLIVGRMMNSKQTNTTFTWGKGISSYKYFPTINTVYHLKVTITSSGVIRGYVNDVMGLYDESTYVVNSANKYVGFLSENPGATISNIVISQGVGGYENVYVPGNNGVLPAITSSASGPSVSYGAVTISPSRIDKDYLQIKMTNSTSWQGASNVGEGFIIYFDVSQEPGTSRTTSSFALRFNMISGTIKDYFCLSDNAAKDQSGVSLVKKSTSEAFAIINLQAFGVSDGNVQFTVARFHFTSISTLGSAINFLTIGGTTPSTSNPSLWVRIGSDNTRLNYN